MFANREDAALQLTKLLKSYEGKPHTWVIGLPRGGVLTASVVAHTLNLPLDIVCPRKITLPLHPEYALGAVAEEGEAIFDPMVLQYLGLTVNNLEKATQEARLESHRRLALYRANKPARKLQGETVIVIDDGIATGFTMQAAVSSLKQEGASQILIATPVLPADRLARIEQIADKLYYVSAPKMFQAVGQFYEDFRSIEDAEVLKILEDNPNKTISNK